MGGRAGHTSKAENNSEGERKIEMRHKFVAEEIYADLFVMLNQAKRVETFVTRGAPEAGLI